MRAFTGRSRKEHSLISVRLFRLASSKDRHVPIPVPALPAQLNSIERKIGRFEIGDVLKDDIGA